MTSGNIEEVRALTAKIEQWFSVKIREKLKKKRGELASYLPAMTDIACTVSSQPLSGAIVGGYFLQINLGASKSLKAALEGFCLDDRSCHPLSSVFFTLSHLYLLHLSHLPVTLHITSAKALELMQKVEDLEDPIAQAVVAQLSYFPKVTLVSCFQGFFFEKMQSRLRQLLYEEINEMISLDFEVLAKCLIQ